MFFTILFGIFESNINIYLFDLIKFLLKILSRFFIKLDPIKLAKDLIECGVGEIFLNSVDRDGLKIGYDLDYLKNFTEKIKIPVIGCGGAGEWEDMYKLSIETKCDGIAAANIFHHVEHSVYLAKEYLSKKTDQFRPANFYNEI